ncbi:hypothetical protein AgCh_008482 [Apium graveolens]
MMAKGKKISLDEIPIDANFSGEINEADIVVCIAKERVPLTNHFKYIGSVRRVESISVRGKRKRGRPRRTWADQLSLDMEALNLTSDVTLDRAAWRRQIQVVEAVSSDLQRLQL